jgi:hypothetical protein
VRFVPGHRFVRRRPAAIHAAARLRFVIRAIRS